MRYALGSRDDGWLIADPITLDVVKFAGCELKGLTHEEAEIMAEMLADIDASKVAVSLGEAARLPRPSGRAQDNLGP